MKNLELKSRIPNGGLSFDTNIIRYEKTLNQKDTYYKTSTGDRLKLREENGEACAVLYNRPDIPGEKVSLYDIYPVTNPKQFIKVFGPGLTEEIVVEKVRLLYLYKNARIHVDTVKYLGKFLEIEVVIKTEKEEKNSQLLMDELIELLNIKDTDKISCGYRELLLENIQRK